MEIEKAPIIYNPAAKQISEYYDPELIVSALSDLSDFDHLYYTNLIKEDRKRLLNKIENLHGYIKYEYDWSIYLSQEDWQQLKKEELG